ncbi:MAG: hypothetical protein LC799_02915, partial [Actinobacteria bacterium]|nr:hypothetical protein [Actinomycetota bacterium]
MPSLRGWQAKIRADLKTEFPNGLTIDITPKFNSGPLKAQAAAAGKAAAQTVKFKAELDRKSLSDSLIGVAALSRAMRTLALPAGLVAATPYVLSFATSLVQASGAAALLPAALTAGGVAAGTLVVGLSGVADTFKELTKADETAAITAAAGGKARKTALESVRSAQEALGDAQRSADRSAVQGAEQVADARRAVADAVDSAARQIKAAQDELTRSEERARQSRDALTRAYKDAREELQQLQFSVEGAGIAEEAAADRLDEARKQLDEARARGAGAEEIADLGREVRQADLDLRMAADRYSDLKAEGAEWARTGISGSQGVVAAQRQVSDADESVAASRAALTRAQLDGDRSVADARRDLGRTIVAVG